MWDYALRHFGKSSRRSDPPLLAPRNPGVEFVLEMARSLVLPTTAATKCCTAQAGILQNENPSPDLISSQGPRWRWGDEYRLAHCRLYKIGTPRGYLTEECSRQERLRSNTLLDKVNLGSRRALNTRMVHSVLVASICGAKFGPLAFPMISPPGSILEMARDGIVDYPVSLPRWRSLMRSSFSLARIHDATTSTWPFAIRGTYTPVTNRSLVCTPGVVLIQQFAYSAAPSILPCQQSVHPWLMSGTFLLAFARTSRCVHVVAFWL
ncbi:hypothetical protein R1flu_000157 [Riccia fluitans]|uniref:Uncharacterized protein n=1 Tax=Riccia fluitans TaxID=41844 RepID=A0ABD1Y2T1_9MARC